MSALAKELLQIPKVGQDRKSLGKEGEPLLSNGTCYRLLKQNLQSDSAELQHHEHNPVDRETGEGVAGGAATE